MNDLPVPTCGDCKALYMEAVDETGSIRGLCRLRQELGEIPSNMDYCHLFRVRDNRIGQVREVDVKARATGAGSRKRRSEQREFRPPRPTLENPVEGDTEGEIAVDRDGLKQVLREILEEETLYGYPELANRWHGGTMVLNPGQDETQSKEIPLDTFFHKIVMVRDRLRVLEAKINGSNKLEEAEKIELQGYISKCYGTLTTFNVLFGDKSDQFRSK